MNLNSEFGLICLLLLCLELNYVSSLMCYSCKTKNPGEEDCIEIPEGSTKYLVNCTAPSDKACRIQQQWMDFVIGGDRDKHIIRQCSTTTHDPEKPCYYRTGYMGRLGVCTCLGDGCNEASRTTSSLVIGTLGLILLVNILL